MTDVVPEFGRTGSVASELLTSRSARRPPGRVRTDRDARTPGDVASRKAASPLFVDRGVVLDWFVTIPGYREELRLRVASAARQAEYRGNRVDGAHSDRDYLGRDVEGCG